MRLRLLVFLLCCIPFSKEYGQTDEYVFSHVDFSNGLSSNYITCFYKDRQGFMWLGTSSGLNRYDGYQYRIFKHDPRDSTSITDNYIEQLFEGPGNTMWVGTRGGQFNIYDASRERFDQDYAGYLHKRKLPDYLLLGITPSKNAYWFVYQDKGLFHYFSDSNIVHLTHRPNDPGSIDSAAIASAMEDSHGFLWVIHQNGLLEKIDNQKDQVVFRTTILERPFGNKSIVPCTLYIDRQDDLWLYSSGVFKGVLCYRPATNTFRQLSQDVGESRLNSNVIYGVLQDQKGQVWVATDHEGIDIVNKKDFSVRYVRHIEDDPKSISENSIPAIYQDYTGTIWLGSYKNGISYYHQDLIQFPLFRPQPFDPHSVAYDDVNSFVEDLNGNIWIGSNGGGLIFFDRHQNSFRQYLHNSKDPNSLCNNIIVGMTMDRENKIWICTYFGGLDCFDGTKFIHYRHHDDQPNSLADDRVMCAYEDSDRNLWIGTLAGGLDRLDRKKGIFTHYTSSRPHSVLNNYISSITEDGQRNLWVGTAYGIDVLEKSTGRFIHYSSFTNQLSSNNVTVLFRDSRDRMWVGTREGLNLFDPVRQTFQSFRTEDGLPDNTIRSIQEDFRHALWVSTTNGLSKIVMGMGDGGSGAYIRCENFHEQDGLQGREFNERSGLTTRDGTILMGGLNGFNMFRPEAIIPSRTAPPILLTGLEIFDQTVHVGERVGRHVILTKTLTETPEIRLNFNQNVFSIEFASLGFISNPKNRYAYMLEGFSKSWLSTDGSTRKATYTNLDPGEYTFHVKASNEDGQWYDREALLRIIIRPPFWKTPLAYLLYFLLSVTMLLLARRMVIQRASMQFAVEHERREARRMHEMDMMKIRFFTNMSHELRTPLSLILAPVDKLLGNPRQAHPETQYHLIRRNAKRLLRLVNQLLDFRKLGDNALQLNAMRGDLLGFIKDASYSFIDLAEKKHISFLYHSNRESLFTLFDHDKIESILYNLLSNAFKFTPERGTVSVKVETEHSKKDEVTVLLKVIDTGIGIAPDMQDRIFVRFFQAEMPDTIVNQGSGIGLAITTEFVKMHNGTITVESDPGLGSCFTVRIPFKELHFMEAATLPADALEEELSALPRTETAGAPEFGPDLSDPPEPLPAGSPGINGNGHAGRKSTILIVEDNEEFRYYLRDNLSPFYNVIEAADGKEGWRKSLAIHPDLVVSDISMPIMNGTDLCKKIRTDERTRQIPVILLTALTGEEYELESLKKGATDYITKPVNFQVLLSKVGNLLEHSETLKRTYQRQVKADPAGIEVESQDDLFVQNVLKLIEKNMSNPNFSVGELGREFHASRSTIYKKILLLTGMTPVEFIRHARLQRAAELLDKSQMTVSEIAYAVGFNNPKYFAQHFKIEYQIVPSAYREQQRSKRAN